MQMQLEDFLSTVITSPPGYFLLAAADKQYKWEEFWFNYPEDKQKIVDTARELSQQRNVYWTAHLFSSPKSIKENVLPTRTIQADLDEANIFSFSIPPTVLVQTSTNRYQGYWILSENTVLDLEEIERLSCKVTYAIPDADHSGWCLGHRVRLPETFNYKYDIPYPIEVISSGVKRIDASQLDILPDLGHDLANIDEEDRAWINLPHEDMSEELPPQEVISACWRAGYIGPKSRMLYSKEAPDRSETLWMLMQELLAANVPRDQVYWLASQSSNNKFKYTRDLRKDVLRAERKRGIKVESLRGLLHDIRNDRNLGTVDARLDKISDIIITNLRSKGRFFHVYGGSTYYCETDVGVPGELPSTRWETKCTMEYGINSSTSDYHYVTTELISFIRSMDSRTEISSLSYFDQSARTVLLHSGGRDVYVIRPDGLSVVANGSTDILFNSEEVAQPFTLDYRTELPRTWYELLFASSLEAVDNMDQKQALALVTAWFMYVILRKGFVTRPLLGFIGQPGSGKSVLGRIIYKVLYGKARDLHQMTGQDDYDILAAKYPLLVYDNVDTYEKWLADRLCASTTETEVEIRRLFTNKDTVTLRRTAMVAVTAHDPKFLRADVVDRLIMITFKRREKFGDEEVIMGMISRYRNAVWGAIVKDIQKILNTPKPDPKDIPDYRIKDFATAGVWIARALGIEEDFVKAIKANKSRQSNSVLEKEAMLVIALDRWIAKNPDADYVQVSELWHGIVGNNPSTEQLNFQRTYRNSVGLGNKLYILQNNLKEQFDIDFKKHPRLESRVWRIKPKGFNNNGTH